MRNAVKKFKKGIKMEKELEIIKVALDSKVVEKIYDDGLSGTTSQIGRLLTIA
ncbi:hypothetical protein [Leptospira sp. Fiocruz LV3954]|uniref:hypothetical protein n=1 Tax=Leptospira sp. Fiocruz LV3954 TaxID=1193012 RepID=UPI0002929440|nr:hypothetical protein [Leptospira sp. Fiocruz LV3954]EKO77223.1 hypothetical protein LEP1GSC068_2856 [Leptospira sp. Fiocruz LV3954]